MKITDKRVGRKTFENVDEGQCFTTPGDEDEVYIKIDPIDTKYGERNAFGIKEYELYTFEDDEEVIAASDIEIIIK